MRGRPVARLTPVVGDDPVADLRARGLVEEPRGDWQPRQGGRPRSGASVAGLVAGPAALIKTVLEEEGSAIVDELWRGPRRAWPAVSCTRRRAPRLRLPSAPVASTRLGERTAVADDLESACTAMALVGIDPALAQHAGEIAELYALRGYDAVHLATALSVDEPDLVLLSWDRNLADAAVRAGRAVIPG